MDVIVSGQHLEVAPHIEERARRKFGRLDRYLPLLEDAVVELDLAYERAKEPGQRYVARATVRGNGVQFRAEERAQRLEQALDRAAHDLTEQARRYKERLYERGRGRGTRRALAPSTGAGESDDDDQSALPAEIGRVKRFAVKPMTVEEALEEMRALGHPFFLYYDAEAEQFALLYRRQAGDIGLIVPELS